MTSKISNKVLVKIEKEKIQPIGRWRFVMQNSLIWIMIIIALVCTGLALSLVIADLADGDWDLRPVMGISLLNYIWNTFPFLWVIAGLVLFFIAYYDFHYWPKSYKTSNWKYLSYSMMAILGVGLIVFYAGWHNPIKKFLVEKIPIVGQMEARKEQIWNQPQAGRLSGVIIEANKEFILIEDFQGAMWTISINNASKPPRVKLAEGEKIKIIGTISNKDKFDAKIIKPWGMGKMQKMKNK